MTETKPQRPGGLTALCILAIVLGAFGVLSGLGGIAAAALQGPMQNMVAQLQPQQGKEAARVQQQIADESREFAQRHIVRNTLFSLARLFVASCLLAGGILTLRLHPQGRKILIVAFSAGIVFELAQIWPMVEVIPFTQRTMQLTMEAQQKGMPGKGQNAEDAAAMMRIMVKAIAAMQVVMMAAMLLAKSGFYAFGLWYLTRPRISTLFISSTPTDSEFIPT
jgi:hypothetical protein